MMTEKRINQIIPKGKIFLVSYGSFDYGVEALCQATEEINLQDLAREYSEILKNTTAEDSAPYETHFVNWLVNVRKCAQKMAPLELHFEISWRETLDLKVGLTLKPH